jgi:hypothetical protein
MVVTPLERTLLSMSNFQTSFFVEFLLLFYVALQPSAGCGFLVDEVS